MIAMLVALALTGCGRDGPAHTPWGASVAPSDVLDGTGYTARLALGDARIRLVVTGDQTILRSTEGDITLVHIETPAGSRGFERTGDGAWTEIEAAAPTWPTALLVPAFADVLVAAAAAEPLGEDDGLYRFGASSVNLSEFGLGTDLFLCYWLSADGRVVRWTLGTSAEAATIAWQIGPIEPEDLEGLPPS